MALIVRAGLLAGALAGGALFAVPASAASSTTAFPDRLGAPSAAFDLPTGMPDNGVTNWGCRWNCGWGGRRGWRRDRVDAGDVLLGAAIIGGIAAIANANNRRERDREVVVIERDRNIRYPDYRGAPYPADTTRYDRRAPARAVGTTGLDNAVGMCVDRIERDVRVDQVDDARRTASGWEVGGTLYDGTPFSCRIGNNGQIETIDYGNGFAASAVPGGDDAQWDAQAYADARAQVGGSVRPDLAVNEAYLRADQAAVAPSTPVDASALPAYPGGPVPGEELPEYAGDDNRG